MSTYVLMRILESAPQRYDTGMRWLTLGRLDAAYDRLAAHIEPGQRVLDIGCGTGALTLRCARRGAAVTAVDRNAGMLEIAVARTRCAGLDERVCAVEMGVAELDVNPPGSFDAVIAGLCFSELSEDELRYTLRQVLRLLVPGGLLLVADEVRPEKPFKRFLYRLLRIPLVAITYAVTQQTTHPLDGLRERLLEAGLLTQEERRNRLENFTEIVARKPTGAEP